MLRNELFLLAGSPWDGAVDFAKVMNRRWEGIGSLANLGGWYMLASEETTQMPLIHAFIHSCTHAFIHALSENRKFYKFINFYIYGTKRFLNEAMCEQRTYMLKHHYC